MKVSTKLRLSSNILIILAIIFIGATLLFVFNLQRLQQKQQLAQKITENSFHLISLQHEYISHSSERPKAQWNIVYQSLSTYLNEGKPIFTTPKEEALFEYTLQVSLDTKTLFDQLVGAVEQGKSETIIGRLTDQLSVKTQERVSNMLVLSELSRKGLILAGYLFEFVMAILAFIISAISIWSYSISRSMNGSLRRLSEGTKTIAGGNLDYKLEIKSKDEFGALGKLFNEMAGKLKESYAGLEQKVRDRTRDLDAANQQLKASNQQIRAAENLLKEQIHQLEVFNKATVGRELKMVELKKELEKQRPSDKKV